MNLRVNETDSWQLVNTILGQQLISHLSVDEDTIVCFSTDPTGCLISLSNDFGTLYIVHNDTQMDKACLGWQKKLSYSPLLKKDYKFYLTIMLEI